MKVLILGGGITGLSAAWRLVKKYPDARITLLEKENRLGGWIRTERKQGFFFEKGPRTFQLGKSPHLLALIRELNLDILTSPPQKRYLLHKGRLRSIGSFLPMLIPYLLRELFISPSQAPDESIYDFAARRFNPKIAETLFDPLTLGIYAGDIRKLSLRACFPSLHQWEREKGSILRGLITAPKKAKGLFTLKEGMETLITTLAKRLPIEIVLNCQVSSIGKQEVIAAGKTWQADRILSALPPSLPSKSIWVVNLVYPPHALSRKGYGYLVPTQEKRTLLGMIFDSSIFPQQGQETRLTAMVRAEEGKPLETALEAAQSHLGIAAPPLFTAHYLAKEAIPQFEVGCAYNEGISVDACIARGQKLADVSCL